MSLYFICSGFKIHCYLACYGCKQLRLPGNCWHIACHRTFHLPVSSFHRHIFASILTLYIVISTLQRCRWRSRLILVRIYMRHFRLQPLAHFPRMLWVQMVTATGEPLAHRSPWNLSCARKFLHRHIFASILTLYIAISTLQCLPMETTFDPRSNLHASAVIECHEGYSSIG